jgi:iron complex transport system ATP-binding protein
VIPASEPLAATDVEYAYGEVPALRGLSLTLEPGAFVGVVGPNGSGKSTLVRILAGYLRPRRGAVSLGRQELRRLSDRDRARRIAVVPQETPPAFDFTALEVVLMGRSPHLSALGVESARDRSIALEAMRRTGTASFASRPLGALSGGERQRVLLARAIAQQTPILLLDEPTAHLDLGNQIEALQLLRSLYTQQGASVLTVLHDLNLASLYCDRLALLSEGRLVAAGPPADVLTEDRIAEVYGARVWCELHPATGKPYVLPLLRPSEASG